MKIGLIIAGVFVALLVGLWAFAPTAEESANKSETQELSSVAQSAKDASVKAGANEAYLYDVRTPQEFNAGNAQNSVNFDNELIQAGQLPDAPKDAEVYVYCRSGNRSAEATATLKQAGYTNVTDLGGLDNMRAAGVL